MNAWARFKAWLASGKRPKREGLAVSVGAGMGVGLGFPAGYVVAHGDPLPFAVVVTISVISIGLAAWSEHSLTKLNKTTPAEA